MKASYIELSKSNPQDKMTALPKMEQDRPLKLSDFEGTIIHHLKAVQMSGGIKNRQIVKATTKGVISQKKRTVATTRWPNQDNAGMGRFAFKSIRTYKMKKDTGGRKTTSRFRGNGRGFPFVH